MISFELDTRVTLLRRNSILLFALYRSEQSELRSLAKIRTRHREWRRALRFLYPKPSDLKTSPTPSKSSSKSTAPTCISPHRRMVTCQRGLDRESFFGTPYRVANQVVLFLTTGMSGDTLRQKSSNDLMRMVASSSYVSALLRLRSSQMSTSPVTESSELAIRRLEELDRLSHPSPAVVSSLKSIDVWSNLGEKK